MSEKYNKGEWSELYVLLKLMADGSLPVGNIHIENGIDNSYQVLSAIKKYAEGYDKYARSDDRVSIFHDGKLVREISVEIFQSHAVEFFEEIKSATGRSFALSDSLTEKIKDIRSRKIKAGSSDKSDLSLEVFDPYLNATPVLGFSIKSQIGNPSTLLNASKLTNFIFKVDSPIPDGKVDKINGINRKNKIQARLNEVLKTSSLSFISVYGETYKKNLRLVDSEIEAILAESLLVYYLGIERTIKNVVEKLKENDPLRVMKDKDYPYYSYKIKKFLVEHALGMIPKNPWHGIYDATGGYIVVRKDGELQSYHLMHKNLFEEYLYNSVKFDSASSNPKRNDYGYIFEHPEHGQCFSLNLMIKFIE